MTISDRWSAAQIEPIAVGEMGAGIRGRSVAIGGPERRPAAVATGTGFVHAPRVPPVHHVSYCRGVRSGDNNAAVGRPWG
jgi:hypothetical protein